MEATRARKFVTGTMSKAAVQQSQKVKKGNAMPVMVRREEEEEQDERPSKDSK